MTTKALSVCVIFQSTQPMRAATLHCRQKAHAGLFQSTQPMRAATDTGKMISSVAYISIHAAHEGCDWNFRPCLRFRCLFQSTQPMRAATWQATAKYRTGIFQSTQPMRAATVLLVNFTKVFLDFNPRSP